ncbi:N-formylglutamate deformylase [Ramlibacter sp. USB13]|uniref:N-formylglutamate deformylase n=1 Tax=Ramlibacter cellulosilyticus TaxID=2764187 RepID=A0A923SBJ5_9BURK|nr:N-formylglutamate deformylase [Ramlibacter cellulosilyticus]MBC5783909.1 N-formylglutamate deformylase [Ramlibacter cellulosilyticus]
MTYTLHRGTAPLLVSIPHMGTEIPQELRGGYVSRALEVEDADWRLDRLYAFARDLGASILQPTVARYVIDLNRPPDDAPMYPGASNTELCPTRFFDGDALYREGSAPGAEEKLRRRAAWWQPYHQALQEELARLRAQHGHVLLWDAHSIRAEIPWLFEGRLPDLNIGTADGKAADPSIAQAVVAAAARDPRFTHVLNGRFKGGYITRQYGRPAEHVHAVQLEMCQSLYMREAPPWNYEPEQAARVAPVVRSMVEAAMAACDALYA